MNYIYNEKNGFSHLESYDPDYAKKTLYNFILESEKYKKNNKTISYMGNHINKAEFEKRVAELTVAFKNMGVKRDEIIGIFGLNTPEIVATIYALNNIGAISQWNNANGMTPKLMNTYLNTYGIKKAVFIDVAYSIAKEAIKNSPVEAVVVNSVADSFPLSLRQKYLVMIQSVYMLMETEFVKNRLNADPLLKSFINEKLRILKEYYDKEKIAAKAAFHVDKQVADNVYSWKNFMKEFYRNEKIDYVPYEHDRTSILVNTGGTTGPMKSIELTDYNLNSAAYFTDFFPSSSNSGDVFMHVIPPIVATAIMSIHYGLFNGFNMHLIPTYNKNEFVDHLEKIKPAHVNCVPAFLRTIVDHPKFNDLNFDLGFLKHVNHGGEGITAEVDAEIDEYLDLYGSTAENRGGYGLSEVTGPITWNALTWDGREKKYGSCGYVYPPCDIKILDDADNDITYKKDEDGNYKIGRIFLAGPILMKGYYGADEELNNKVFKMIDGVRFFDSGDLGYLDEDECLFHKGRASRIIRTIGGGKIFVPNLENIVSNMEEVELCSAVAMPLDNEQKVPAVHIVLKDKYKNAENIDEIIETLTKKIDKIIEDTLYNYYNIHSYIISNELPMTPYGKVAFQELEKANFRYFEEGKPYLRIRKN